MISGLIFNQRILWRIKEHPYAACHIINFKNIGNHFSCSGRIFPAVRVCGLLFGDSLSDRSKEKRGHSDESLCILVLSDRHGPFSDGP